MLWPKMNEIMELLVKDFGKKIFVLPRCAHAHNCLGPIWGGDVFVRLYIRSSASPRLAAVGLGCWNCEHVVLKLSTNSQASPQGWQSDSTSGSMTMMKDGMTGCRLQNAG